MPLRHETSTCFMDEVRIISRGIVSIAILGFLLTALAVFANLAGKGPLPIAVVVPGAIVAGTAVACYILLIGYINKDAGRRGMSRALWTLIAIFVPNALGIVLYFILRKPRISHCPQCSALVEPGFGYCPRCRCRLTPLCPQCQRSINASDKYCPYCGGDLATNVSTASVPVLGKS